jgi:predicted DNA-binding transcriptional regulator AlpA
LLVPANTAAHLNQPEVKEMQIELLTIPEFLAKFSISRTSFYREVSEGRLKILKLGRSSRIAVDEANRWLTAIKAAAVN